MLNPFRTGSRPDTWSILPSTAFVASARSSKATIQQCMDFWPGPGTVVVCQKPNGSFHFIAGGRATYAKPGDKRACIHDQTRTAFPGPWTVTNEIQYAVNGALQYAVDPVEGVNVPKGLSAPVACFK